MPELVLDGDFSIHEFCPPCDGKLLLTRGTIRPSGELYVYRCDQKEWALKFDHNPWLKEYGLGEVTALDLPTRDREDDGAQLDLQAGEL